jgi:hypothetical protein
MELSVGLGAGRPIDAGSSVLHAVHDGAIGHACNAFHAFGAAAILRRTPPSCRAGVYSAGSRQRNRRASSAHLGRRACARSGAAHERALLSRAILGSGCLVHCSLASYRTPLRRRRLHALQPGLRAAPGARGALAPSANLLSVHRRLPLGRIIRNPGGLAKIGDFFHSNMEDHLVVHWRSHTDGEPARRRRTRALLTSRDPAGLHRDGRRLVHCAGVPTRGRIRGRRGWTACGLVHKSAFSISVREQSGDGGFRRTPPRRRAFPGGVVSKPNDSYGVAAHSGLARSRIRLCEPQVVSRRDVRPALVYIGSDRPKRRPRAGLVFSNVGTRLGRVAMANCQAFPGAFLRIRTPDECR